jgi:4-phosphopantoate--beta-alanine ligase
VIAIDLNPFSRTSETADIPIVDELSRALRNLRRDVGRRSAVRDPGEFPAFDAAGALREARQEMARRLLRERRR